MFRDGAPHLVDPSRLERSARRCTATRWTRSGESAPVPEATSTSSPTGTGLECFPTPGHASHHVSYLASDGSRGRRRAAGVRIVPAARVCPAAAGFRQRSVARLDERRQPERLALIHFGVATDVADHLALMREELRRWVELVRLGGTSEEFVQTGRDVLSSRVPGAPDLWERAAPLWQSYLGIERYLAKRAEADAAGTV
jgi:hypothetical protein